MKYFATGMQVVEADSIEQAGEIFAHIKARRTYGEKSQTSISLNNLYPGEKHCSLFQVEGTAETEKGKKESFSYLLGVHAG